MDDKLLKPYDPKATELAAVETRVAALDSANQQFAACGGAERHPLANKVYLIKERSRPGETMPIMEDEHGTYIMNSKDLRAVEHVERLVKMGIDSLKIEGRTKSLYYVARTAQVYRKAIDDAARVQSISRGNIAGKFTS